ncbi:MAG: hypothetical protein GF388_00245 [Candidatus Aegiribacteria sp.]|nr:hypothetical protein [Candidatus Aegiribacteria sp.]MBD3293884.1 hypothetical protein [Candidatus Fermentibacteria bacterium]
MRRSIIALIAVSAFCMTNAGSITRTVELDPARVTIDYTREGAVVEVPGGRQYGVPETPQLPAVSQVFLLPDGARNVTVSAVPLEETPIVNRGLDVLPAVMLRPLSSQETRQFRIRDQEVYGSSENWPLDILLSSHTGTLTGSTITTCLVQPWVYTPREGSLSLVNRIEITVQWQESPPQNLTFGQRAVARARTEVLEEDGRISAEVSEDRLQGGDSQYLIVCDSAYTDELQPLATYHQKQGLTVETATVQTILSTFTGSDDAEKLRNFLIDRYQNHGTIYVLLAGDETLVPVRMVYLFCEGYVDSASVDLYFADLDGTWDGNGDGEYGQPDDDLDLYADVLLGRGLFSTEEQAELFVQKNLTYQDTPPEGDWQTTAVLCGAVLFEEIGYTSGKGCDSIAVEFPAYWEVNKFYEELPGGGFTEHIPIISSGSAWNHYAGHGNDRGIYWHMAPLGMMTSWIATDSIHNGSRSGIHTSIACHPGEYVDHNSCAEALLNNPDGGGTAVLFNTSYGWEGHWPSLGASEWMCIDLARQVFGSQASSLGLAFSTAKDLRIPYMEGGYDRTFQSVLAWSAFMDPALKVMRTEGNSPLPPQNFNLYPPYPNPSMGGSSVTCRVNFDQGTALVSVHDLAGRLIWSQGITSPSNVVWDGTGQNGERVPTGVYIFSAKRGDLVRSRLITVLP